MNEITCPICPRHCSIKEGSRGFCLARGNSNGEITSLSYGKITSQALDPIEKKPLKYFMPGSMIYSIGSFGCNLECSFCQNHSISRNVAPYVETTPREVLETANSLITSGNIGVAYTYNEPLISPEFLEDTSKLVRKAGLFNVLVSNGYLESSVFRQAVKYIDAANIDVKSFSDDFYTSICKAPKGALEQIMKNIEYAYSIGIHVEITHLVIPGKNDSLDNITRLAKWISSIDKTMPLHLTRFFPQYKLTDIESTPVETLKSLRAEALKYLDRVHLGNVW